MGAKVTLSVAAVLISLAAQGQYRERVEVEIVDVPVYVTNNGAGVTGLTKDDFELFVNGKPQHIDYFDPIDFSAPAPAVASEQPAAPRDIRDRRLFLLL